MSDTLRYTALIWDADGTLFDTYPGFTEGFVQALRALAREEAPDEIARLARISLGHAARVLAERHALDEPQLVETFQQHYAAISPAIQPPFPGVLPICQRQVTAGGRNFIYTHRGRASLERLLDAHNMTHLFAGWVTADDGVERKPDPAGFNMLVERHDLPRGQTLGIGDRALDVLGAQAAGLDACFFGAAPPQEAQPEFYVANFEDLAHILFGQGT